MSGSDGREVTTDFPQNHPSTSVSTYVLLRFFPPVAAFIAAYVDLSLLITVPIVLFIAIIDFYLTKSRFGIGLVGLQWYFNRSEAPDFPFLVFYCRPFPFIAKTLDSNIFWVGFLISIILDIVLAIIFTATWRMDWMTVSFALLGITGINFSAFLHCHQIGKIQAGNAARSLLLDTSVAFQKAKEFVQSDSQSEEESVAEGLKTKAGQETAGREAGSDDIE
jgi:hypothetical protein